MSADSYEVLGTLGTGATGTVYLARETALERDVALKELSPALTLDPSFIERFRAEARIMASLDHPNCVKVYDFFEAPGRATLVSEYVRGASLRQVLDHAGHLTPEQSLGVLKGALSGLAYAHGRGLVHRDIKPENMLADSEGVSKLADFGQALVASGPGAAGGMPAGSPAYMSPEMIAGGRVDLRTDIYSLGAVLFEFFTGRAPFTGDNPLAVMRKHLNDPVPDPRSLNTDLPPEVSGLVTRAMAKDPDARQRTAEQFLDELEAAAVAGYGADWEKRSSIKRLVEATMAALGLLLLGAATAAAAGSGAVGEAAVGGVSKWLVAGGFAGVALLAFIVFGLASGLFGGHNQGGVAVAVAVATPSPSEAPSPTPEESPSPTPEASPSPSPSPSPSIVPSPSPSKVAPKPSPVTTVTFSNLQMTIMDCGSVNPCTSIPVSQYENPNNVYPIQNSSQGIPTCTRYKGYLVVRESYNYTYASGSSAVTVHVVWQTTAPVSPPSPPDHQINAPSGAFGPDPSASTVSPTRTIAAPGTISFSVGSTASSAYNSPTFYYSCY